MSQVLWVLDHLADLEADFLAWYRIDNLEQMESAKFFRLAERVAAYDGVMRARVLQEAEQQKKRPRPRGATTPSTQRRHLREAGGEVSAVPSAQPSYLTERLKEARR